MNRIIRIIILSIFLSQMVNAEELSVVLLGQVVDSLNNPVPQAEIRTNAERIYTDTNGNYRLDGLLPGIHQVEIFPPENTNLIRESTSIYLNPGTNTINFTLAIGGVITGIIRDEQNNPVANVNCFAIHPITRYFSSGISNSEGKYTICRLVTGNYWLIVEPSRNLGLAELLISGISVTQLATTTQDIILPFYGSITGKIVDHEGNPAINIEVTAKSIDSFIQKTVNTDANGEYLLNRLTPGTYTLQLKPSYQYRPSIIFEPLDIQIITSPSTFTITLVTSTVTFSTHTSTFTIPAIEPAEEIKKALTIDDKEKVKIKASPSVKSQFYPFYHQPTLTQLVESIRVNSGKTTYKDMVMVKWAKIKGCVKNKDGHSIPNAKITLWTIPPSEENDVEQEGDILVTLRIRQFVTNTTTNSSGEYSIPWLEPISYTLEGTPPQDLNLVKKELTLKNLSGGTTTTQDIILDYGGIIKGCITDESGKPVINTSVVVLTYCTSTDSYGNYTFIGIPPGIHLMKVSPPGTLNLLSKEIYSTINEPGTVTQDIILTQGGILQGKIDDEFGTPISDVEVRVKDKIAKFAITDSNGLYQIEGLPTGDYWLEVVSHPTKNLLSFNMCGVNIKAGTRTIQNITLHYGATLSGKIKDEVGNPIINAFIRINGSYDRNSTHTDYNGEYTFNRLIGGIYKVYIDPPANSGLLNQEVNLQIPKGTTTIYDFILSKGLVITGLVTDNENQPVIGATVKVGPYETITNFYGSYTITGLSKGIYSLSVTPPTILNLLTLEIKSIEINNDLIKIITLSKGGILTGIVKDERGRPIPGAKIYLNKDNIFSASYIVGDNKLRISDTSTTSEINGNYKFVGLSNGTYTVRAVPLWNLGLGALSIKNIIIIEDMVTTQDITFIQSGTISGRIIDLCGRGVSGVQIRIYSIESLPIKDVIGGLAEISLTTDANGYFTLGDLGMGTYTLTIRPSGYYSDSDRIENILVIPGSITYKNIILDNWGMVKGRVTDEKGLPVPQAKISIQLNGSSFATTNSNGEYEIPWIEGNAWYKLSVSLPSKINLLKQEITVYIPKGTITTQNFILQQGGILTGIVKDALGNLINGAEIRIIPEDEAIAKEEIPVEVMKKEAKGIQENSMVIKPIKVMEESPIQVNRTTYTNLEGRYTIVGLSTGTYTVIVNSPYANKDLVKTKEIYEIAIVKNATTTCDIVLEKGDMITGYVLDEFNQPINQVNVRIAGYPVDSNTDSTGKYQLLGLPPGRYKIQLCICNRTSRLEYTIEDILVTLGATTIQDIILNKSGVISGRVTDTSGNPIINARVNLWSRNYQSQGYAQTDSTGKYIIDNLLSNESYYGEIRPPTGINLITQRIENISLKSGTTTILNIRMSSGGIITGTITDTSGKPIERVEVYAQGNNTYSDVNGHYTINGLSPGIHNISAIPPFDNRNLAPVRIKGVKVTSGTTTVLNIILPVSGTLTGYVKDKEGNLVANVGMSLDTDFGGLIQTQPDGKYTFYNLSPGTYSMTIHLPQNSMLVGKTIKDIGIISGKTTIQDVILDTGGIIQGVVTDANLNPVANISIRASAKRGDIYRGATTDVKGRYTICLHPGTYTITAIPPNEINLIQQSYQNIVIEVGATTTLNFVLQSGGIITGTVSDEFGNLINNVQVMIWEANIGKHTRTNFNGQYTIKGLSTGVYQVEVIPEYGAPYFARKITGVTVIVGEITQQNFILTKGGVISGEIVDQTNDGREKKFCVFAVSAGKKLTIHTFGDILDMKAVATCYNLTPGAYSLSPIPPGNYDLYWWVECEGIVDSFVRIYKLSSNLSIAGNTYITNQTITLTSITGGIYGTITIPESYSNMEYIFLTNLQDEVVGFTEQDDPTGQYSILYLYPGTYSIWVRDRNNMVKIKEDIIVEEGKITTANITFPAPPLGTITGLVKGVDEKPISGTTLILIAIYKYPPSVIAITTTNAQGVFSFYNLRLGNYRLKVLKQGYISKILQGFYLSSNEHRITNITLLVGEGITGIINKYEENEILLDEKVRLVLRRESIDSYKETISIIKLKPDEIPPVSSAGINIKPTNIAYDFKPDNLKFIYPATITLFYSEEGLNEDKLAVFYYNGTKWVYIGGKVNKQENSISFQTNHLSLYAIMEYTSLGSLNKVICYPNPFYPDKGSFCTIVGIPSDAREVKVMIYNIAGELVKIFELDEIKEGIDCKYVQWDGTNEYNYKVAYGVYIYVVTTDKGIQQGKIALLR